MLRSCKCEIKNLWLLFPTKPEGVFILLVWECSSASSTERRSIAAQWGSCFNLPVRVFPPGMLTDSGIIYVAVNRLVDFGFVMGE